MLALKAMQPPPMSVGTSRRNRRYEGCQSQKHPLGGPPKHLKRPPKGWSGKEGTPAPEPSSEEPREEREREAETPRAVGLKGAGSGMRCPGSITTPWGACQRGRQEAGSFLDQLGGHEGDASKNPGENKVQR